MGLVGNAWSGGLSRCLTDGMRRRFGLGGFFVRQIGLTRRSFKLFRFLFLRHILRWTRCALSDGNNNDNLDNVLVVPHLPWCRICIVQVQPRKHVIHR